MYGPCPQPDASAHGATIVSVEVADTLHVPPVEMPVGFVSADAGILLLFSFLCLAARVCVRAVGVRHRGGE